ncbi:MAG TPA: serine hydrolase [Pyrinomonadaceae bacterium]|nr:serine hydrolase [Pyrinomonadaceae bacterium]
MTVMRHGIALLFAVLASATFVGAQGNVETFDRYAESARKQWGVPGMSLVVVQDGKVLLAKGYGIRELGKNDPVDNDTLFGAMSTTKAMVAVAMGILVDEGKVKWDDKVIKHLPDFRVADSYVTKELTVRDLFTHNAGMGNADFLWATLTDLPSTEIVSRMQYAKPTYSMRGGFIYNNLMYLVAGQVIEKVSGMPWERFMTERVFSPLGMKNTYPTLGSSLAYANRSVAHYEVKGELKPIPEMGVDAAAPAGAVWSTANDIGKWVNFNLGINPNGKEIVKPATLSEILKPHVVIPATFYPSFRLVKPHWTTYGLGWFQHDYRGEMVHMHTGSLAGRTALVAMMRDKKLGVYIFGNVDHVEVRHALIYKVFDLFGFNDNSRDWSTEMKVMFDGIAAENKKQAEAFLARRIPNTTPSLPLTAYVGVYSDPFYGAREVRLVDGKLHFIVDKRASAILDHWHHDAFRGPWNNSWRGETMVTFQLNAAKTEVEGIATGGGLLKRQSK